MLHNFEKPVRLTSLAFFAVAVLVAAVIYLNTHPAPHTIPSLSQALWSVMCVSVLPVAAVALGVGMAWYSAAPQSAWASRLMQLGAALGAMFFQLLVCWILVCAVLIALGWG